MATEEEKNLRDITKQTEKTVTRTMCDARGTLVQLEGPEAQDGAERARADGLMGGATALSEYALELEQLVQRIRRIVGTEKPEAPTASQ